MKNVEEFIKTINGWADIEKHFDAEEVKLPFLAPKDSDQKATNAFFKFSKISKVAEKITGEEIDFNNADQWKYFNVFRKQKDNSGFGFAGTITGYDYSDTIVGPRLSFLDLRICRHVAQIFSPEYNDLFAK